VRGRERAFTGGRATPLKRRRFRHPAPRKEERKNHQHEWNGKECESAPVISIQQEDGGEQERPDDSPNLVESLVHGKPPSPADRRGGVREYGIACRHPDAFPHPLKYEEEGSNLPGSGKREERDGNEHPVAYEGERPVMPGGIGQVTRRQTEGVAEELTQSGDNPDGKGAGAKEVEVRPGNAPRPFIDYIAKEADNTKEKYHCIGCAVFAIHKKTILLLIGHKP